MQIRLFALLFFVILCCILECNYGQVPTTSSGCPLLPAAPPDPNSPDLPTTCPTGCNPPCPDGGVCCPGGIQCVFFCITPVSTTPPFLVRSCPRLPRSIMSTCNRGRRVGSRCRLSCAPGFVLFRARSVVTCRSNRQWRGIAIRRARCRRRRRPLCPPLSESFRSKCTRGRLVGSSCSLSCPPQHYLQGPDQIRCQANRKWSTDPTTIRCESVPTSSSGCPLVPAPPPNPNPLDLPTTCPTGCNPPCPDGGVCCPGGIQCAFFCIPPVSTTPQ